MVNSRLSIPFMSEAAAAGNCGCSMLHRTTVAVRRSISVCKQSDMSAQLMMSVQSQPTRRSDAANSRARNAQLSVWLHLATPVEQAPATTSRSLAARGLCTARGVAVSPRCAEPRRRKPRVR